MSDLHSLSGSWKRLFCLPMFFVRFMLSRILLIVRTTGSKTYFEHFINYVWTCSDTYECTSWLIGQCVSKNILPELSANITNFWRAIRTFDNTDIGIFVLWVHVDAVLFDCENRSTILVKKCFIHDLLQACSRSGYYQDTEHQKSKNIFNFY